MKRSVGSVLAIAAIAGTLGSSQAKAVANPKFAVSTLRLPNGEVLTTQNGSIQGVKWKDVDVYLQMLGATLQHPYGQSVVGNHSQILSQKFISTPNGKAWFALNKRTPPAASHSTKATYEYWVAMERTSASTGYNIDYCIEAVVIGDRTKAEGEVKQLVSNWTVPSSADGVADPSVNLPFALMTPNTNLLPFKVATRRNQVFHLNQEQAGIQIMYQNATKSKWIIEFATNGDSRIDPIPKGAGNRLTLDNHDVGYYLNDGHIQRLEFTHDGVYYMIFAAEGPFKGWAGDELSANKPLTTENGLLSIVNSMVVYAQ